MSQCESDQPCHNGRHDRLDQRLPFPARNGLEALHIVLDLADIGLNRLLLRGEDFNRRRQLMQRPVVLL